MRQIKIGVVCSSRYVVDTARKIAHEKGLDFDGAYVGFDAAIPIAQQMEINGAEAILARTATPPIIRENVSIPVLSFTRSATDIMACIKEAASFGKNILFISFYEKISGLEIIEDLLNCHVTQIVCQSQADLERVITSCRNQFDVVVGGAGTTGYAMRQGMSVVETKTPEEVIVATIDNAISVIKSNREEQKKAMNFKCIIDSVTEGVISFDLNGKVNNINNTAKTLLKIVDSEDIHDYVGDIVKRSSLGKALKTQKPILDQIEDLNDEKFVFSHIPIVLNGETTGIVTTFRPISNVIKVETEVRKSLSRGFVAKYTFTDLVHKSSIMNEVIKRAKQFASTHSTILIVGETGTGKEILAQSIHDHSPKSKYPFVSINCAALSEQLLESELFGYEEGAFTGSRRGGKPGLFEIAHKGTIFLDEILSTSQRVQQHLLRVLQEKEVMRIGADHIVPVEVRVIAASNNNIEREIHNGLFREDLFFRLNILRISLPALRDRLEDIPLLMKHFLHILAKEYSSIPFKIPREYLIKLEQYPWPGNVRQLRNFSDRLYLLCGSEFKPQIFEELYFELMQFLPNSTDKKSDMTSYNSLKEMKSFLKIEESEVIRRAIETSNYNKSLAAKKLGISRTTLWKKLKGIE